MDPAAVSIGFPIVVCRLPQNELTRLSLDPLRAADGAGLSAVRVLTLMRRMLLTHKMSYSFL